MEIASGDVDTGLALEAHFWNIDPMSEPRHIDLTWHQFAQGSRVRQFTILDRDALKDSPPTVVRCQLLLERVLANLTAAGATVQGRVSHECPAWVESGLQ
jgi:hypothetical protein